MNSQSRYSITFFTATQRILLEDFNVQLEREGIFKPTIGNDSLHQDSNHNGVRVVNLATSNYLVPKRKIFPQRNTRTSPDRKTNSYDLGFLGKRWHSNVLEVRICIKCKEFLDQLNVSQLLHNHCAHWDFLHVKYDTPPPTNVTQYEKFTRLRGNIPAVLCILIITKKGRFQTFGFKKCLQGT